MDLKVRMVVVALVASVAALVGAGSAVAGLQKEFSVFDDCPVSNPAVTSCIVSYTTSGEFHLGNKAVPINKTITLQGGLTATSPNVVPAADGNTLSKTALQLPGGLIGIELLPGLTEVQATAELTGPVVLNLPNFFARKGVAVSLPIKVNLGNPLLGGSCYIGSNTTPVELQLTSGVTNPPTPNKPISGSAGKLEFAGAGGIIVISGGSVVDNSFSVPGASGCGGLLSLLIDPSVDLIAGVPAAAGHNTAILNNTFENVSAATLKAERELPELGRCVKLEGVGQGKEKTYSGSYADPGCLTTTKGGRYEWSTGPGASPSFTVTAGASTLETVGGAGVRCTHAVTAGQYTGAKTATATTTFTGCKLAASKEACQSAGAASGEIVTSALTGSLGFITDAVEKEQLVVSVGLDLTHSPSLLTAECASGSKISVSGSVIAPIGTVDKPVTTNTLSFSAVAGRQAPERFEEGAGQTLVATIGAGSPAQAGLTSKGKVKNAEAVEVKAET
jgi:hypothetical protein